MSGVPSKESLVAALRSTFIGDSQTLKETTAFLAEAARHAGMEEMMQGIRWR